VWRILTSMRSVDPDAPAQMVSYGTLENSRPAGAGASDSSGPTMGDDEL